MSTAFLAGAGLGAEAFLLWRRAYFLESMMPTRICSFGFTSASAFKSLQQNFPPRVPDGMSAGFCLLPFGSEIFDIRIIEEREIKMFGSSA